MRARHGAERLTPVLIALLLAALLAATTSCDCISGASSERGARADCRVHY